MNFQLPGSIGGIVAGNSVGMAFLLIVGGVFALTLGVAMIFGALKKETDDNREYDKNALTVILVGACFIALGFLIKSC